MFKRVATFLFGVALVSLGILFFITPERSYLVQGLILYWPIFLILAGVVRFGGHLLDRQPRSPMGGLLLMTLGGILLAANLNGETNFLTIFGRSWFFLLLAFIAGRVLRQYTHRPEDGRRPRAFTPAAIVIMLLLTGGGLAAHRIARDNQTLSRLQLPVSLGDVRDIFRDAVVSEDTITQNFVLTAPARLIFNGLPGDLEVRKGVEARATLVRKVKGTTEAEGKAGLQKIRLQLDTRNHEQNFSVVSDDPDLDFSVRLIVELPAGVSANVEANEINGMITLVDLQGDHTLRESNQIAVSGNQGAVSIENPRGSVNLSQIEGQVAIARACRETVLRGINGEVALQLTGGNATIERVNGNIKMSARSTRVEMREINGNSPDSTVELRDITEGRLVLASINSSVTIEATRTQIEASEILNDLQITSSSERIRLGRVTGKVRVLAEKGTVEAADLQGPAEIEATREVTARNFHGPLTAKTTLGAITLEFESSPNAEVNAISQHGDVKVTLPEDAHFGVDADTSFGRLRVGRFTQLGLSHESRATSLNFRPEAEAPVLNLRSTNGNITLKSSRPTTRAARQPDRE
jgi:DUF4097 and DUF4098 domain-containing protein YvlB/uncharacterized membrane protein HdeD (DUF308 family)